MAFLLPIALAGLVSFFFVAWLLWPPAPAGRDRRTRTLKLIDAETGALIHGTEDLVFDEAHRRLIVSAYDRRKGTPGALYLVPLAALASPDVSELAVRRLAVDIENFHPHGIGLGNGTDGSVHLHVVNRLKERQGWRAELLTFRVDGERAKTLRRLPVPFGANDVCAAANGHVLLTIDRADCAPFERMRRDALAVRDGAVVTVAPDGAMRQIASNIAFANGIAADARAVYVAATRDRALHVYAHSGEEPIALSGKPLRTVPLAGAPDNLSWGSDGRLYIAVHDSVLRFAAFRFGWRKDSPGSILVYDPKRDENAASRLVSLAGTLDGPTVALEVRGLVVAGAAFGTGLALSGALREA
jgi:hypothetical protein